MLLLGLSLSPLKKLADYASQKEGTVKSREPKNDWRALPVIGRELAILKKGVLNTKYRKHDFQKSVCYSTRKRGATGFLSLFTVEKFPLQKVRGQANGPVWQLRLQFSQATRVAFHVLDGKLGRLDVPNNIFVNQNALASLFWS